MPTASIDAARNRWIGVREDHTARRRGGQHDRRGRSRACRDASQAASWLSGHDFFSSPRLSPDGRRLALARLGPPQHAVERHDAVSSPSSMPTARLRRPAGDRRRRRGIDLPARMVAGRAARISSRIAPAGGTSTATTPRRATRSALCADGGRIRRSRNGSFGMATYALRRRRTASSAPMSSGGLGRLAGPRHRDRRAHAARDCRSPTVSASVRAGGDRCVCSAARRADPAQRRGARSALGGSIAILQAIDRHPRPGRPAHRDYLDHGRAGRVSDRRTARPHSACSTRRTIPTTAAPAGEKPPLLVKCHGGPTGAASSDAEPGIQYWTSRGIAVLDVNYGGSTGYGRAYRERLNGNWGIVDVDDCVNGAQFLAAQRLGRRRSALVISGGSAGGYTTLAALRSTISSRAARATTASAISRRWRATPTSSSRATSTG